VSLSRPFVRRAPLLATLPTLLDALECADDLVRSAEAARLGLVVHLLGSTVPGESWCVFAHREVDGCDICEREAIHLAVTPSCHLGSAHERGTAAPDTDGRSASITRCIGEEA